MLGIIAGTGIYKLLNMKNVKEDRIYTPFGEPSDALLFGILEGKSIAFLSRHGRKHTIPPHRINNKANIWLLKNSGIKRVISVSAVGSLKDEIKPGTIVFPDQLIDFGRVIETFYNGPDVYHVSLADPFCKNMRKIFIEVAEKLNIEFLEKGTYIRISGPRFSTRAESKMFRRFADIIGMTVASEAILAREMEICYANISMVTDYDVWAEKPVDAQEVLKVMKENSKKVEMILRNVIKIIDPKEDCECKHALESAKV